MKRILIIAGPNGAGKTTFASEFLPGEGDCPEFVNADLIAAGLSPFRPDKVGITAGRLMLRRMKDLAKNGESFAFETTLSSKVYLKMIPDWQSSGYLVTLHFLQLPHSEFAIRRVRQRVSLGGHDIPMKTIERRFERGWIHFNDSYKPLVNHWFLHDSTSMPPRIIESGSNLPGKEVKEESSNYAARSREEDHIQMIPGIEAALRRASEKAIARARAAGLEPVVATDEHDLEDRLKNSAQNRI